MDYITFWNSAVRLSVGLRPYAKSHMRLYTSRDGSLLALRNERSGEFAVAGVGGDEERKIFSSKLCHLLRWWRKRDERIPAVYAPDPDAVLLAWDPEELDENLSKHEFQRTYVPIAIGDIRYQSVELSSQGVYFRRPFPLRAEVACLEDALAFYRGSSDVVTGRVSDQGILIQNAEVVDFARSHWNKKPTFRRMIKEAMVISSDPIWLVQHHSLTQFRPLNKERLRQRMWVNMERSFTISGTWEIADILGNRASVCSYGKYLGLMADEEGDILIEQTENGSRIASRLLYLHLMTHFSAAERLYLVPHGKMLLFSAHSAEREAETYPPQEYFCRLVMAPV